MKVTRDLISTMAAVVARDISTTYGFNVDPVLIRETLTRVAALRMQEAIAALEAGIRK